MRQYAIITASYWAFTLTDGALRMLVVLHFHQLGYSPLQIATVFIFYELFGVVTSLVGGWLASRMGLAATLLMGLALQVLALGMLLADPAWLTVPYVMAAQALSGIAKDLNKMSAKSGVKLVVSEGTLYRWVSLLTGSKNALKGVGFFLGASLLAGIGFRPTVAVLAGGLAVIGIGALFVLDLRLGRTSFKARFTDLLSKSRPVNRLSAARFFLFGSRDVWFVVALPVFLQLEHGWSSVAVGGLLAAWVIGYGGIQALAPRITGRSATRLPDGRTAVVWGLVLTGIPAALAAGLHGYPDPATVAVAGLVLFGVVFAINSAVHSYLIVAYADADGVTLDVGFYYMSNAAGRLLGTVLSGAVYQRYGFAACLITSSVLVGAATLISLALPTRTAEQTGSAA